MILPVIVAALAAWLFGAAWYGILSKPWMAAKGLTVADTCAADGKKKSPLVPMLISFIGELVMASALRLIMPLSQGAGTNNVVTDILVFAVLIWFGFIVTTQTINNAFGNAKPMLTVIDCGHWLGVILIQTLILGLWY
jgi:hypothetical protein